MEKKTCRTPQEESNQNYWSARQLASFVLGCCVCSFSYGAFSGAIPKSARLSFMVSDSFSQSQKELLEKAEEVFFERLLSEKVQYCYRKNVKYTRYSMSREALELFKNRVRNDYAEMNSRYKKSWELGDELEPENILRFQLEVLRWGAMSRKSYSFPNFYALVDDPPGASLSPGGGNEVASLGGRLVPGLFFYWVDVVDTAFGAPRLSKNWRLDVHINSYALGSKDRPYLNQPGYWASVFTMQMLYALGHRYKNGELESPYQMKLYAHCVASNGDVDLSKPASTDDGGKPIELPPLPAPSKTGPPNGGGFIDPDPPGASLNAVNLESPANANRNVPAVQAFEDPDK